MNDALRWEKLILKDSVLVLRPWQVSVGLSHSDQVSRYAWVTLSQIPTSLRDQKVSAIGKVVAFEQPTHELEENGV